MPLKPCLTCGELGPDSYCTQCRPVRKYKVKPSRTLYGYDEQWRKLSAKARRLSPFCEWCNTTHDLTTDHLPEAWVRRDAGKPIRLRDVRVLCRSCNSRAGKARSLSVTP